MSATIIEKRIVIRAIDKVTEPLAQMNERLAWLEQALGQVDQKFTAGAGAQSQFKTSLNELRASASETDTALDKLNRAVDSLSGKSPKIKPEADTAQANAGLGELEKNKRELAKGSPTIKPKVDETEATKGFSRIRGAALRLRDIVGGNLIAGGITAISSHLTDWAKQGFEAAKAGSEVAERWKNLGMTESQVKATGNAVKELKENSNLSGEAVGNLITRFYGFTGSATKARELATGVASLSDKMKLSQSQADGFANGLTRIESSGKVTAQSLGRLERTAPGLTKALQQASGMSKKSFDELLSSGKMTSDQFNDILAKASESWKENSKEWNGTVDGALHHMKTSWDDAKKAFMAPLVNSAGSGLGALSKALDRLTPLFTAAGKDVANLSEKFAKWLTPRHVDDIGKIVTALRKMVMVIGKGAWKAFSGIINGLTAPFRLLGSHGKKAGDAFDKLADGLDAISKNKAAMKVLEGIGMILATQFAYSKLFKISGALFGIKDGLTGISKVKISGHLFKDLTRGLKGLTKIRINPANWFKGGTNWAKDLFKVAPEEALKTGDKAGGNFLTRFAAKTNSSRFAQLGRTTGGKLISGIGLAFEVYDLVKDLHGAFTTHNGTTRSKDIGKAAGAGIGAGIGFFFGGPAGAALGGMIGRTIGGKIGPAVGKFGNGIGKVLNDIFVKHDWNKVWSDIGKGWQSFWKGMGDWWDKTIGKKGSSSSSSHKSKQPSEKEIKSLGGNHYSKADIANVKEMNRAITTYTRSLRSLKDVVKHNDPSKSLDSMNKGMKNFIKEMLKSEKPLDKVSKTFKNFGKVTKTIANSMKNLTGKHGLGDFDKDLTKLDKETKHSKVGEFFEKLSKSIKKSKLTDQFKQLTKYLGSMVKDWEKLVKPMKQADKEFASFEKTIGKLANKRTGLSKVDSDIKTLSKDLKKYDFGKTLSRQMAVANRAVGKHGFIKEFSSMTKQVENDLRTFGKAMKRDWEDTWKNLSSSARNGLSRANNVISRELSDIKAKGKSFESGFKSSWDGWLDDIVSAFRSGFGKLPGIAARAMSDIIGRLNKGISGINAVISDFGGDKQLGMIHYARGTFAPHPGGKAIVNDGPELNKTELIWQPSKGWGTAQGQNVVRDLEAGSMVLDAKHSAPHLGMAASLPHYASGTLSEDEQDKIAEQFMDNPVLASKNLMLKLTDWNSSTPLVPSFGKASAIGFSRGIANVLKDLLGIIKEPINGDWTPVIKSAFRVLHLHAEGWQIAKLLRQIQTESGGDEGAIGGTDGLSDGHATGLLQFKPGTFAHWADPRYNNLMKGFDQLVAAIRCLNAGGEGGWGNIGNGHGWASGVHMTHPDLAWIGDNPEHDEYVINPYNANAIPLLNQAWNKVKMNRPDLASAQSSTVDPRVIQLLGTAVEKIDNIDIHPRVYVDDIRRPVNNRNAMDYSRAMN